MTARHFYRIVPIAAGIAALAAGLWTSFARLGFTGGDRLAPSRPTHGRRVCRHDHRLGKSGGAGPAVGLYGTPCSSRSSALLVLRRRTKSPPSSVSLSRWSSSSSLAFFSNGERRLHRHHGAGGRHLAVGNFLLFSGWLIPHVVPWWAGFLILTIAGERIEMSRLRPHARAGEDHQLLCPRIHATLFLTLVDQDLGVASVPAPPSSGSRPPWPTATSPGQPSRRPGWPATPRAPSSPATSGSGFRACWAFSLARPWAGSITTAWTHSIFVGFVIVMIMAHAPIILPAVLGVPVKFTPLFYTPVTLLHLSLALRVTADLMLSWSGRRMDRCRQRAPAVLFFIAMLVGLLPPGTAAPVAGPLMKEGVCTHDPDRHTACLGCAERAVIDPDLESTSSISAWSTTSGSTKGHVEVVMTLTTPACPLSPV